MTPEILHRCESCGAAIREPAMFCPECGQPLATARQDPPAAMPPAPEMAEPAADGADHKPAPTLADTVSESVEGGAVKTIKTHRAANMVRHGGEKTRDTLHRASSVARGAIEDNVKRVEKIHHVSTVMLEEAHYDPSLRFVLVALGLFIVFIILLILSKVMG